MSQINVGFDNYSPQAIDRSYGNLAAGVNIPYVSVAAAVASIVGAFRYRGKTVVIDLGDGSGAVEYWWRAGVGDSQLVPKINGEQSIEFIIGDGGANTPADQSTIYPGGANPGTLVNCKILGVGGDSGTIPSLPRTGYQSYQYNATSGLITLVNTLFSLNSWYYIKYRQL